MSDLRVPELPARPKRDGLAYRPVRYCLRFSVAHGTCHRVLGHEGPHRNRKYEWNDIITETFR